MEYLLLHGHVATIAGIAFAMSPFIRLSFALTEDRLAEACRRIVVALGKLTLDAGGADA